MCPRIVLIEDDEDIRESLSDFLQSEGYSVQTYPNGKEALEDLAKAQVQPCLILLDLMMPVMDGFQFLKARKNYGDTLVQLPTYVVSAVANKDVLKGQDVSGYLNKPLDIEHLLQIVEGHVGPQRSQEKAKEKEMAS